ncbi:hypothetical protein ACRQ5Q_16330 [Bradyrhizobium sp. PMVTL-01]|uniref:hypothetical protein n=1 Tax=Bradyrhizobium sp. PMVTL-01 TaxID=3434999 RepID=UPI003F703917
MMAMRVACIVAALVVGALPARAEDRSVLVNCKAIVERASKDAHAAREAELTRCRQLIREWALRDARMAVDEEGKPLR